MNFVSCYCCHLLTKVQVAGQARVVPPGERAVAASARALALVVLELVAWEPAPVAPGAELTAVLPATARNSVVVVGEEEDLLVACFPSCRLVMVWPLRVRFLVAIVVCRWQRDVVGSVQAVVEKTGRVAGLVVVVLALAAASKALERSCCQATIASQPVFLAQP